MTSLNRTIWPILLAGVVVLAGAALLVDTARAGDEGSARKVVSPEVLDVVLTGDGRLSGRAVDGGGLARPGRPVRLLRAQSPPRQTVTDPQGAFHFENVPPGSYHLDVDGRRALIRVWSPAAAPPSAAPRPIVITGRPIVRGQLMEGESMLGLVTAAGAVAGVTVATVEATEGSVSTPLEQPPGSTAAGPFSTDPVETGDVSITSLRQVTLETTGTRVDGIDLRAVVSP